MTDSVRRSEGSSSLESLALGGLLGGAVLAFPTAVAACPDCAGSPDASLVPLIVIGALLTLPFLLAFGVVRLARRGETVDVLTPRPGRGPR